MTVFQRDFDEEMQAEDARIEAERLKKFTQADLDAATEAARAAGFEGGLTRGRVEATAGMQAALEQRQTEAFEKLVPAITALLDNQLAHQAALERHLCGFTLRVCERVFPEFIEKCSTARVETQIRRAMEIALRKPSLTIRLSPANFTGLKAVIEASAGSNSPSLDIVADPALADGDIHADWEDGVMDYSFETVCRSILLALRQTLAPQATPIRKAV
ncbi:FliH/SctL family protein [Thioclava atlantica]|uniref:Putative FliH-like flagellar biosynthesis protein n=1 Tax=Thioclava atlantica TaxID=1317124 RepID=A0A085TY86_9RHOB|nr:FliH/SctL family protein [Thioclava atlantica]KFE35683.1 putative FliH-like flagellar biosynthesis protein [Thioclava atlantica]